VATTTRPPTLDPEAIYHAADQKRRGLRISWRKAAEQADLHSTHVYTNLGRGRLPDVHNLNKVLLWIGLTDLRTWHKRQSS
jgi:hypothetical protein